MLQILIIRFLFVSQSLLHFLVSLFVPERPVLQTVVVVYKNLLVLLYHIPGYDGDDHPEERMLHHLKATIGLRVKLMIGLVAQSCSEVDEISEVRGNVQHYILT